MNTPVFLRFGLIAAVLSTAVSAQTIAVPITTVGTQSSDHLRPADWEQFTSDTMEVSSRLTFNYDVTVTNNQATPYTVTLLRMFGPSPPNCVGGNQGFGTFFPCYGSDPGSVAQFPIYGPYNAAPVTIAPGASFRFTGSQAHPSFVRSFFTGYCFGGDGVHGHWNFAAWPPTTIVGLAIWETNGGGNTQLAFVDHGSGWNHELTIGTVYDIPEIGINSCTPVNVNSTGAPGRIRAYGNSVGEPGERLLRLRADQLPASQFGYYLLSQATMAPTPLGTGAGTLCLGGPINRWHASTGIVGTSSQQDLDPTDLPIPGGAIQAGETWFFQLWHRDSFAAGSSNATNVVGIAF